MTTTCGSTGCVVVCALAFVAWWLIASGLLLATWNKVVRTFVNVKAAKYWQALLLVATVCAFCVPTYVARKRMLQGHCCDGKKDCPYSKKTSAQGDA